MTAYFVSPAGSDSNDGLSTATAWQTITKVNAFGSFVAGDTIYFQSGQTFVGPLVLNSGNSGSSSAPVTFDTYNAPANSGPATITSTGSSVGINGQVGCKYQTIQNLNLLGPDNTTAGGAGINLHGGASSAAISQSPTLRNLNIYNWGNKGIVMSGFWNNVLLSLCKTHDNLDTGISLDNGSTISLSNVTVDHCNAYNNTGFDNGSGLSTGSGIILGGVSTGTITRCLSYNNGHSNQAIAGPVGIWAYNSTSIGIYHNESHHNGDGSSLDGEGFDFDWGCQNCLMFGNYSHDNFGAGYLAAQAPSAPTPWLSNRYVYNISQNDGTLGVSPTTGITIANADSNIITRMVGGVWSNNNVFNQNGYCFLADTGMSGMVLFNNQFVSVNTPTLGILAYPPDNVFPDVLFRGNLYWNTITRDANIRWGNHPFKDLASWRAWTLTHNNLVAQETLPDGTLTGVVGNPLWFGGVGGGGTVGNANILETGLPSYLIKAGSSAVNAGVDPRKLGYDVGTQDFYDYTIPPIGVLSCGASQYISTP